MSKALRRSLLVGLALVGIAAGAAPASAQSACYTLTPTTTFKDLCNSPTDSQYEYYGSESNAVVSLSGSSYLLYGYPNAMRVFNVSSPMSPVETASTIGLPWSETGGTGGAITDHLRGIITLDDFPYAFTALYTLGWDFFKILPTPQFLAVGYHPTTISQQQSWLQAALFRDSSGAVYLVGQRIDAAAVSGNDRSVYIYHIGDGATLVSGISAATMANNRVMRIPLGGANDPAPYNTFNLGLGSALKYDVFSLAGKKYLLVRNLNTSQAALVDISDAVGLIAGQPVAMWTTANTDAKLWEGQWAVDGARGKLYAAAWATTTIHVFDISGAPAAVPAYVAPDIPWYLDGTSAPPISPSLRLNGDLLAVGSSLLMGYLSVGGVGGPIALPDDQVTGAGVTKIVRSCTGPYGTYASQLTPFVVAGEQYVMRSLFVWGDILHISQSCMSTTPVPNLSITPATGFPGDRFTITNTSTGSWVNPVLTLSPNVGTLTGPVGKTYTWDAPTNQSVQVQFDLSVQDANNNTYTTQQNGNTRTVTLQNNPHAAAQVTGCSVSCPALQGETVTVSASLSQGHPSGFDWVVKDPSSVLTNQINVNPITVSLAAQGNYTVYAVAHYAFAAADDSNCADPAFASLNLGTNNTYDSCTSLAVPSEPFSVGGITVSDGITSATSTSSPTPTLQRSRAITFSADYRLSTGYTATFTWGLTGTGAPAAPAASYSPTASGTVTGTIAAGTFAVGAYTALFTTAQASPTGGGSQVNATVAPVPFNVADCQAPGPATLTSPTNGQNMGVGPQTVTFTWSRPAIGTAPFSYDVANPAFPGFPYCSVANSSAATASCSASFNGQTGPYSWAVFARATCDQTGSTSQSATSTFYVTPRATPTPTPTPPPGSGLRITSSKNPANVGDSVTFTLSPSISRSGDTLTVLFGDGTSKTLSYANDIGCQIGVCTNTATHAYAAAGTYTVSGSGVAGGSSVSGYVSQQVSSACQLPSAPTAAFAWAPAQAQIGQPVQFTDQSTGTPTAWSWSFGDGSILLGGGGSSALQNPSYTYAAAGTYTVQLNASNCRGSSTTTRQVQVLAACTATVVPTADFTWAPQGPLAGFPNQMQPYVGQTVTLTDASTNAPTSWQWYDFQELTLPPTTVYVPTFTATWTTSGDKNVRMKATNCIGQSAEVLKVVHVYDDVRPVVADFSWSPANPAVGSPVTFTAAQGSTYGNPTGFTWSFDDGTSQTGAMVTYTFRCGGPRTIALTSARGTVTGRTDKAVTVTGQTCGPESVMTVDAAKVNGLNGTSWRTDVRIFNPSDHASSIKLAFLPVGQNNLDPFTAGPYQIGPMATLVVNNILDYVSTNLGKDFQKTAMRVTYENTDSVAPIVMARTYTPSPTGGNYGQFAPGIAVVPNSTPSPLWITGLRNNGLADGFRTNYSLVNLRDDAGGVGGIKFTLFDGTGAQQGVATLGLAPFGYLQDSVSKLFGGKFDDIGIFSLKVDVPQGADIQAYASVMDNHTGDPVLIPAVASPDSPVYLPAVAHLNGEAGTVWRTDLQLTNPDPNSAHTWELRYTPKGGSLPIVARNVTLAPDQSGFTDDLIAWIYQDALPADAATSGVVRIEMAPTDASNVFPIMAARSYNVTPNGTFGQSIAPLWAALGVSSTTANKHLLITGMSSEDIARTNFGFVNLSEAQGVNFSILFYDQNGALLNPQSGGSPVPYTFALGPGGWDQDKLENRFRNAFKVNLPSDLESISAVITVSDGGPGFVYATVIDNQTGDPNFIPAQQAP